jgi:UDP-N-acetylmuramate: L-alanyl-gamma-D-glutamyl-meso-diaminopimelate ligase
MSKEKTRVVIGGSHGKTSITAMVLHVLSNNGISVDYMVGAQLKGFETMVHLTDDNDFILLEGDEYLSSPIDRRPKFHLYKPNIALLSGISWDHINVFPSKEDYSKQFEIFLDTIVSGGVLVYNEMDLELSKMVIECNNSIRKLEYSVPNYFIKNGISYLSTDEGDLPLKIIGEHNLCNLSGAKLICQLMGVHEEEFHQSIITFEGAPSNVIMD